MATLIQGKDGKKGRFIESVGACEEIFARVGERKKRERRKTYSGGSGFPYGRIERTQNASENLLPRKRNQK